MSVYVDNRHGFNLKGQLVFAMCRIQFEFTRYATLLTTSWSNDLYFGVDHSGRTAGEVPCTVGHEVGRGPKVPTDQVQGTELKGESSFTAYRLGSQEVCVVDAQISRSPEGPEGWSHWADCSG